MTASRDPRKSSSIQLLDHTDITDGPSHLELGQWLLDYSNHAIQEFQTGQGPIDVRISTISPEDGSGKSWMVYGQVTSASSDHLGLFVRIRYQTENRRGHALYSTAHFLTTV